MDIDKQYFIKSIVSLIILVAILFLYLNINIKKSKLNKELSINTSSYIELKGDISKLETKYNRITRNEILEKKAVTDFQMRTPESGDIIRLENE